jgi:putative redox protein
MAGLYLTIEMAHAILDPNSYKDNDMSDQWREIEAEWKGGDAFIGSNPIGGIVQMGRLNDIPGISPMELILVGLAGCTGVDIVDILHKKREPLKALKVKVRGKKAEDFPKIYTEIEVTYLIWGEGIDPKSVERAIQLSEDKYCSVSAMLRQSAQIRTSYQILTPEVEIK